MKQLPAALYQHKHTGAYYYGTLNTFSTDEENNMNVSFDVGTIGIGAKQVTCAIADLIMLKGFAAPEGTINCDA